MENPILTEQVLKALEGFPLYSQDGKGKNAVCRCLFTLANVCWFVLEGQREGEDFTFYGIVTGLQTTEYGYFTASELAALEYDLHVSGLEPLRVAAADFDPTPLAEIPDFELQEFLAKMYD